MDGECSTFLTSSCRFPRKEILFPGSKKNKLTFTTKLKHNIHYLRPSMGKKYQLTYKNSEGSDPPVHPCSLISSPTQYLDLLESLQQTVSALIRLWIHRLGWAFPVYVHVCQHILFPMQHLTSYCTVLCSMNYTSDLSLIAQHMQ